MIIITELLIKNFILVDVRCRLSLLVISAEITDVIVVRVVLPVAVLHHLALGQVRTPFNELGKPGDDIIFSSLVKIKASILYLSMHVAYVVQKSVNLPFQKLFWRLSLA